MATETLDKELILQILTTHQEKLSDFGVEQIGLFGSFSRNESTADSDIDLLVNIKKEKKRLKILWLWPIFWKIFLDER